MHIHARTLLKCISDCLLFSARKKFRLMILQLPESLLEDNVCLLVHVRFATVNSALFVVLELPGQDHPWSVGAAHPDHHICMASPPGSPPLPVH